MTQLRNLSGRPELVVDGQTRLVADPTANQIGLPGPLGRARIVSALPLNKAAGPVLLKTDGSIADTNALRLADAAGNLIGMPTGVWVHRWLAARWTEDTRRLAG